MRGWKCLGEQENPAKLTDSHTLIWKMCESFNIIFFFSF